MPLMLAQIGEENIIRKICGSPEIKQHLENLGFVVGGTVTVVVLLAAVLGACSAGGGMPSYQGEAGAPQATQAAGPCPPQTNHFSLVARRFFQSRGGVRLIRLSAFFV